MSALDRTAAAAQSIAARFQNACSIVAACVGVTSLAGSGLVQACAGKAESAMVDSAEAMISAAASLDG